MGNTIMKTNVCAGFVVSGVIFLSGCSTVTSTKNIDPATNTVEEGINYYLPAGVVQVSGAWDQNSGLWDFNATPIIVPDIYEKSYNLKLNGNCLYDNTVGLQLNPNPITPLLQSVNVATTDQSLNSVASVAAAIGAVFSAGTTTVIGGIANGGVFADVVNSESIYDTNNPSLKDLLAKQTNFDETVVAPLTKRLKDTHGNLSPQDSFTYDVVTEWMDSHTNLLTDAERNFTTNVVAPDFDYTRTNASFSAFQSFLVAVVTNDIETNISGSHSLPQLQHSAYVLSPMVNGVVTYAQFDMSLKAQDDTSTISFPQPSGKEGEADYFDGVLVRDPVPYTLTITGHLWLTHWITNTNYKDANPFPSMSQTSAIATTGAVTTLTGTATATSSPLSYLWAYGFTNNYSVYGTNLFWGPKSYIAFRQTLYLPDANHTHIVKIDRRPLVQDSTTLTLANGMLVGNQKTRPSEFFAWVGIFKSLITALVPIPGGGGGAGAASTGGTPGATGSGSANAAGTSAAPGASGTAGSGGAAAAFGGAGNAAATNPGQYAPIQ